MLSVALVILGTAIIAAVMADVVTTTLAAGSAGGWLTTRLIHGLWAPLLRVANRRHRLLRYGGLGILLAVVGAWVLLLWVAWAAVFNAEPTAVVTSADGRVASPWERVYFTGETLFTLGSGEYVPAGPAWQLATVAATGNGLFLVTLAITYLIPVSSASTEKRRLGSYVSALGGCPDLIVARGWDGAGFTRFGDHLVSLTPLVIELGQRHLAYPVLHNMHSVTLDTAAAPSIAALDEALTIMLHAVPFAQRPEAAAIRPLREALSQFLGTLHSAFIDPTATPPPPPPLDRLASAGVPRRAECDFLAEVERLRDRRRLLRGLVEADGWSWDDVLALPTGGGPNPTGRGEEE